MLDILREYLFRLKDAATEMTLNSTLTDFTWLVADQVLALQLVLTVIIVVALACIYGIYRRQGAMASGSSKPRFRKRDKVIFYGRKMLRKVRLVSAAVGPGKKRKMFSKITRKLLMKKEASPTQMQVLEPPVEYLQEDVSNTGDQRLPLEVTYMLQSMRMFGIFERPLFLELCKHMDTIRLIPGQFLFRIGEADENFYVVRSGRLNVFIAESDGTSVSLKVAHEGDSIGSLLSFTDVLTGHPQPFKTVSAQALEDSVVLSLPVSAFQDVFEQYPDTFVRVIQIVMIRLNRVTFTALHQHLGLSHELVQTQKKKMNVAYVAPGVRTGPCQHSGGGDECSSKTPDLLDSDYGSANFGASCTRSSIKGTGDAASRTSTLPIHIIKAASSDTGEGSLNSVQSDPGPLAAHLDGDEDLSDSLKLAIEAFRLHLNLENDIELEDLIHLREIPAGAYLVKEDSQQDSGLVLVLKGVLTMSQRESDRDVTMFNAYAGEFVGALCVLTGEPSIFTVKAKHHTRVAIMTSASFYTIMSLKPKVVLQVANIVVRRLSPFVRQIDFAMDWTFLESGRALYRQGDVSDCTYIVLSGRLRSVITQSDGKKQLLGEYGRGDLVGIVETLTCMPRSTTVMAVRDSELAKLPEGLLNAIKLKYPIVVTRLINLLGRRIIGSWQQSSLSTGPAVDSSLTHANYSTVAFLAVTDDVPLSAFTYELMHSLTTIGTALRLTSEYLKQVLGTSILDTANEYKLNSWLGQQEDKHRIVLYQCDSTMTAWTQRCIRQADCILIVAMGDAEPTIGKVEKQLEHLAIRTQKELVLLHKEDGGKPKNTAAWRNVRSWCSAHHHLQCPKRMFTKRARMSMEYYARLIRTEPNVHSDFSRLARWLTGTSIGLVLGGGGARGAAHVGMIKAIQEVGIPVDMVGGVSIGAFMAGLWAAERNTTTVTQKAREMAKKMTQWWRQILDLTYPVTSMFSGAGFNQLIRDTFNEIQIEDLWIPYYTVTTDINSSCMRVHTHGSLWRYVRASMSLSGYMPPLCDPSDGHLLLDGGYVNNLPADVLRKHGARFILAVDVGSQDDTDLTNYGDSLSGWWLLWQRWTSHFRSTTVKVPNLPDIQSRLAYVSCVRQLEEVRNSDYCHYIRPPIDKYKTLEFGSFDEIKDVGYHHGRTYFDGMMKGGAVLPLSAVGLQKTTSSSRSNDRILMRPQSGSYNFTDLAQMVCNIRGSSVTDDNSSDEDDNDDQPYGKQEFRLRRRSGNQRSVREQKVLQSSRAIFTKSSSVSENDVDSEV